MSWHCIREQKHERGVVSVRNISARIQRGIILFRYQACYVGKEIRWPAPNTMLIYFKMTSQCRTRREGKHFRCTHSISLNKWRFMYRSLGYKTEQEPSPDCKKLLIPMRLCSPENNRSNQYSRSLVAAMGLPLHTHKDIVVKRNDHIIN